MYRDYGDKTNFFFVYKALAHPEVNRFVPPFSLAERLMHIGKAKKMLGTTVPWICDTMLNEVSTMFGGVPNGEFILDPEGKIVRKRFWSNAVTLRADLEELVGKVDKITKISDLENAFVPETNPIGSGVVPRIALPRGLGAMQIEPMDSEDPFFAKLRVEGTQGLVKGTGDMYLGVYLDPLYAVHWNNRMGKVRIDLECTGVIETETINLVSDDVEADADIDPRQFLIRAKTLDAGGTFIVTVSYTVCDDAETFCKTIEQQYEVSLLPQKIAGTRPGVFLFGMFLNLRGLDTNGDGNITVDEIPPGKATLYRGHMDYDGSGIIEASEIETFMKMFNNGKGITTGDDGSMPARKPLEPKGGTEEKSQEDVQ